MYTSYFDTVGKTKAHIAQAVLIILIFVLAIVRLVLPDSSPGRSNVMAVTFSIKSAIIIAYQLLTEHKERFQRWASFKANAILNCVEILFWFVLVILSGMSVGRRCEGASCGVTAVVMILALTLMLLTAWVAAMSIVQLRRHKAAMKPPPAPPGIRMPSSHPIHLRPGAKVGFQSTGSHNMPRSSPTPTGHGARQYV